MKFDRDKFFAAVRAAWGPLNQAKVAALTDLLDNFEADEAMTDVRWIAYALATIKHECADTYKPIAEYGKGKGRPYGKKDAETGQVYYGRGFVQLTWKRNYEKMGELTGVDLVNHPDFAMDPEIAYQVLSVGMRDGLFTGKKLSDYINTKKTDYFNARKIINAMDRAQVIADFATRFQSILEEAAVGAKEEPVSTAVASTEITTTTTEAPPAAAVTVTEEKHSLVSTLASSDTVKDVAKSGVTSIGSKVSTGLASGGLLAAIDSFVTQHWAGLIFAGTLVLLAVVVVLFILWHKHEQQKMAAQINSDPTRSDIKL